MEHLIVGCQGNQTECCQLWFLETKYGEHPAPHDLKVLPKVWQRTPMSCAFRLETAASPLNLGRVQWQM